MKIKLYNVRGEEAALAQKWSEKTGIEVDLSESPLNKETAWEARGFDGVANAQVGPLDAEVYGILKELGIRQIAQRSAGVDMYDLALAKEQGIAITNVPSYSPESIAEFTVTIALNLIRNVETIRQKVAERNFTWGLDVRGQVLGDRTVAIIGTGRIGAATARFFKGFGCRIIGYDLYRNPELDGILEYKDSIVEAVAEADVISLHLPATKDSYHLFDDAMFQNCRRGSILLNMARGAIVDTQALFRALDAGIISGAGLDTYENEGPFIPKDFTEKMIDDPIFQQVLSHPKIIYTPHVAYYTDEAVKNIVENALNASVEMIRTGTTACIVNP